MRASRRARASLFVIVALSVTSTLGAAIPASERAALLALFNATGGPSWSGSGGWGSAAGTECSWSGISCNEAGTTVTHLSLGFNNLVGTLPQELSQLTNLEELFVPGNDLGGAIPSQLGSLSKLKMLDLGDNHFTGSIPQSFSSLAALETLALSGNEFTGTLPTFLGSLTKLTELQLSSNQFTGSIPVQLAQLPALVYLDVTNNALTGNIPPQLGALTQLEELRLGINGLSGSIPPELGNLSKLTSLDLGENKLSGPIPSQLGQLSALTQLMIEFNTLSGAIPPELGNLTRLTRLWAGSNGLTGSIPTQLTQLTSIESLDFESNELSGTIPSQLGAIQSLQYLGLSHNNFTGTIPPELGNASALIELTLGTNQLTGPIPASLGNLSNLTYLDLEENQLTGTIPVELANLTGLTSLFIASNLLTGSIPPELGELTNLTALWAQGNGFTGTIPPELGQLVQLRSLFFYDNELTGSLPRELGQCTQLDALDFGFNHLTGSIPPELGNLIFMNYFGLAGNELTGSIPPELGQMSRVVNLDLSSNKLTGPIPPAFGDIETLEFLDLRGNQLSGSIPPELGQAPKLEYLFLSDNDLTGTIPPQLGSLPNILYITLGQNRLHGPIPPQLGDLSTLEGLQVELNNLSGPVPPQLMNLASLIDEGSDFGYNALYTNDPALEAFLDLKEGGSFREFQTVTVKNAQIAAVKSDTVVFTWDRIAYYNDPGGYAISVSTSPGGAPVKVVTTPDKSITSYAVDGLSPQTTWYFVITTVSYPFYIQKNTVISEPTATMSATTTAATISPPLPVVTTYPSGLVASVNTSGAEDYYQIRNYGDQPSTLTIGQSGDFFTQSQSSVTIEPDEELYVELRGLARPAGAYSGTVLITGTGFSNTVRIPVKMLSAAPQTGTAVADANADRVDVAAPSNENPAGSATFTNLGNGPLNGIVVSDTGFIVPQTALVTIAPGASASVTFQIDRSQRPDAGALSGTVSGTLSLVYATGGAGSSFTSSARRGILDSPGVSVSLVTVVDTVKPATSSTNAPPLGSTEVALLIPGIGHRRDGGSLFISDVTITNVFGVSALGDLSMYFTPSMDAPLAAKSAPVAPVAPGQGVKLADVVTSVFAGDEISGTMQIRTRDVDKIYTSANIFSTSNPLGTTGALLPIFRSDRALEAEEALFLTGMRKSATAHTDIFVQETAGNPAKVTLRFYSANGTEISSLTESIDAFRLLRLLDRVPAGAVTAQVTNDATSAGRIVAYATPVDEQSGDFWSVADWRQLYGADIEEPMLVPVAGTLRGMNDTHFRTDLSLNNVSDEEATGTLEYFPRDAASVSKQVTLEAGQTIEYLDVIGTGFGFASGSVGYLLYTPDRGAVAVSSRTYASVGERPGTYATGVPALPQKSGMRLGQSRQINGIDVSSSSTIQAHKPASFRSNVGLVETGGASIKVRVTASYADNRSLVYGPIESFDIELEARGFVLLSDLNFRLPPSERGEDMLGVSLRFEVVSGEGAVIPFVTSVDNGSGDHVLRTE